MSNLANAEKDDDAADPSNGCAVIAVFSTAEGNFRYFVESDGYDAVHSFAAEDLVAYPANLM